MKILVIGSGGREHALAWRLALEGHDVYAAPGNPGISRVATLVDSADAVEADLTVVGPEGPLVEGVVDSFRSRGLPIVGPSREAARLEASKIHSKEFMRRIGIPTARSASTLDGFDYPVVVKADGLAAGKGVIIARDR